MFSSTTLLTLPAEVRLIVYAYLFHDEWIYIGLCNRKSEPRRPRHRQHDPFPAILRSCRQLQQEATPVYYSNVQVHFDMFKGVRPVGLIDWCNDIGESNATLVRKFEMRWNNYIDISLNLRRDPSTGKALRISSPGDAVQIHTYHQRLAALLEQSTAPERRSSPQLYIPLLQLSTSNPTTSTEIGASHVLSVQGVPLATALHPTDFWTMNGTTDFCRVLSKSLSGWLDDHATSRGTVTSVQELLEFTMLTDEHATALRWLGYW